MTQNAEALSSFPQQRSSPEEQLLHVVPPLSEQLPISIESMHRAQEHIDPRSTINVDGVQCALVMYGTHPWAVIRYTDVIDTVKATLEKTGLDSSANFDSTITYWLNKCFYELNTSLGIEGIKLAADRMDTDEEGRAPWFQEVEKQQRHYDNIRSCVDQSLDVGLRLNLEVWSPGRNTWKGRPVETTQDYFR